MKKEMAWKFIPLAFSISLLLHLVLVLSIDENLSKLNTLLYFNFLGTLIFFISGNIASYFVNSSFENRFVNIFAGLSVIAIIFGFPTLLKDPTQIIPGRPVFGYLIILYLISLFTLLYLFTLSPKKPEGKVNSILAVHSYGIYVYQAISFPLLILLERIFKFQITVGIERFLIILVLTIILV